MAPAKAASDPRAVPRDRRPVRFYRATANAFFVPIHASRADTMEAPVNHWSLALQPLHLKNFVAALNKRGGTWGLRISREGNGQLMIAPAQRPEFFYDYFNEDAPAILEGWFSDLRLDDAEARKFQQELATLYMKHLGREGAQRYLVRMALAPMSEGELPANW